jgi:hypothetical protein
VRKKAQTEDPSGDGSSVFIEISSDIFFHSRLSSITNLTENLIGFHPLGSENKDRKMEEYIHYDPYL